MGIVSKFLMWLCLGVFLSSCAQGHCRRKTENQGEVVSPDAEPIRNQPSPTAVETRVFVYKYDGSLQCKQGKPLALDVMAKQLKGITIYSSTKKRDGLMHIQVCGSITGQANVYEIPAESLKKAESLGFKKWSFE